MEQKIRTTEVAPFYIKIHTDDNVAIIVNSGGLRKGARLENGLEVLEHIPEGHKVALTRINQGDCIRRYGVVIGNALKDIAAGSWVHEQTMQMPIAPSLNGLTINPDLNKPLPPLENFTFKGYKNSDGSVGTRNLLAISTTVQCVAGVMRVIVDRIRRELLPQYPNVDDVVVIEHTYGCGIAIEADGAQIPIRTLRNLAKNPNFGGEIMVVSLGCEKLQPERLMPTNSIRIAQEESLDVVRLQDPEHIGLEAMIANIMDRAKYHLQRLDQRIRVTVPASELIVGVQCGGSDAFSGVTANPALGFAVDLLVRCGATVMFSENTEVRDGIDQLVSRAETVEVAQALIREMDWFDQYLARSNVDRSANTTPGNKRGGLSNIVEKAMGSIIKSGSAPISGVLGPGEKLSCRGLVYASTPASDFICGTLQMAAGMTIHVFTTGRGTPYGLAAVPVVKVGTRTDLARRWHDLIDINAGTIADAEETVPEVGWRIFNTILATASGEMTYAEKWGLHNALTLFNPGPVT